MPLAPAASVPRRFLRFGSQVQFLTERDFSGGLNRITDQYDLGPNEVPDCQNIDFIARGGWTSRRGLLQYATTGLLTTTTQNILSVWQYEDTGSTFQKVMLQQVDGATVKVYRTSATAQPTTWTDTTWTGTSVVNPIQVVVFKDLLYTFNGVDVPRRYNGTLDTWTTLTDAAAGGGTWHADYAAPTGGTGIIAKVACVWQNRVWVASTVENNPVVGTFRNRLRFSHPNSAEDWRVGDLIEVDTGFEGDHITALVPVADRLYIFKRRAIYVLTGIDDQNFNLQAVSKTVGALSWQSVINTEVGIFFWDQVQGVHVLAGGKVEYVFAKIRPVITDGTLNPGTTAYGVQMAWFNKKLFVGVPLTGTNTPGRTYVFDSTVGQGAWTMYDTFFSCAHSVRLSGIAPFLLAPGKGKAGQTISAPYQWEVAGQYADNLKTGGLTAYASYVQTRWYDAGHPALKKRWRRPTFVLQNYGIGTLTVQVLRNFDISNVYKNYTIPTTTGGGIWSWNTPPGSNVWGGPSTTVESIVKGSSGGLAYALSLRINGPVATIGWGVDTLALRFIPMAVR